MGSLKTSSFLTATTPLVGSRAGFIAVHHAAGSFPTRGLSHGKFVKKFYV